MDQDKIQKLAGWIMGVSGGFMLRGNLFRHDDALGYLSTFAIIGVGLVIMFAKPRAT